MSVTSFSSPPPPIELRRFSNEEFEEMVEAGVFAREEGKVELAEGRVIVAPVDGGPHLNVGQRLTLNWTPKLAANEDLKRRMRLFVPGTIRVREGAIRAPDAMLAPPETVGKRRWPTAAEVLLALEFSDTTLAYDDGPKRADYAMGGLRELWVVRVAEEDIRVCRGPRADGGWDEAALWSGDQVIAPLAAPELAIPVRALFEG
jgi:Uma2 family endonuclease